MDNFFKLTERGTNVKTEVIAGFTMFLATAYILPVNTLMLSETGMPVAAVFLATALSALVATLIMGLYANYPITLAPGMGTNAFFTYTVVLYGFNFTWQEGLSIVLVSGILFLIVSLTGLREYIINAIPRDLKFAVSAGIGFFIAFLGFKNAGIIVSNPATFVGLGDLTHPTVLLSIITLIITLILYVRGNKFAIFIGMICSIFIGLSLTALGVDFMPQFDNSNSYSDFSSFSQTFGAAFTNIGSVLTRKEGWLAIFTFLFIDFFDTTGTLLAVGKQANLTDENDNLIDSRKALMADSVGTVVGAGLGTSTVTSFIESIAGIEAGGRTGLSAVVAAMLFGLSIFLYPLLSIVNGVFMPEYMGATNVTLSPVTSAALIMVGALMVNSLKLINWDDFAISISAFFTIMFMVLSFSISAGIAIGFTMYTIIMIADGRRKEINPVMIGLSAIFVLLIVLT